MSVLKTFGVDWGPFLAQVITVLIVYVVLSKYAFGPVMAMLEARRKRIAQGEANLKEIESKLSKAEERVQAMLDDANKDAERLISEARESASALREQKSQEAINEAQQIIEKARVASKMEHEKVMSELKGEFGRLLMDATTRVSGKVLDANDQKRINEEALAQASQ